MIQIFPGVMFPSTEDEDNNRGCVWHCLSSTDRRFDGQFIKARTALSKSPKSTPPSPNLKRALGLPLLVFYGVGTIIGGGFYALTGEVAGKAGMLAPFAFGLSALIALVTAFSFAELSSRFPVSRGEAHYIRQAFGRRSDFDTGRLARHSYRNCLSGSAGQCIFGLPHRIGSQCRAG